MKRSTIGLHIRVTTTITQVAEHAHALNVPFFQTFSAPKSKKPFVLAPEDIQAYRSFRDEHFTTTYLHGSYWLNPCNPDPASYRALKRDLALAQDLAFTHYVLHPGNAKALGSRQLGIEQLARTLNRLFKKEQALTILLENTAHAHLAVGSDIEDFYQLLRLLEHPDRIQFCIDTAHAHAFGYDVITPAGQEAFVKLLDETIGLKRIALLHLNDTKEARGSFIDQHEHFDHGVIGAAALERFITRPELVQVPIIMELPVLSAQEEQETLVRVTRWRS